MAVELGTRHGDGVRAAPFLPRHARQRFVHVEEFHGFRGGRIVPLTQNVAHHGALFVRADADDEGEFVVRELRFVEGAGAPRDRRHEGVDFRLPRRVAPFAVLVGDRVAHGGDVDEAVDGDRFREKVAPAKLASRPLHRLGRLEALPNLPREGSATVSCAVISRVLTTVARRRTTLAATRSSLSSGDASAGGGAGDRHRRGRRGRLPPRRRRRRGGGRGCSWIGPEARVRAKEPVLRASLG